MKVGEFFKRVKRRFLELWEVSKIFKYAVFLHIFYFFLSMFLLLFLFRDQNDFLVYFKAGEIFYTDITQLYNQDNYLWDFRYLPLSAAFFVPFYLIGFEAGFVLFHVMNFILNILICLILYKIINVVKGEEHEENDDRVILYISLFLMGIPQMFNYVLGQINIIITFFILLSLLIFLKSDKASSDFLASVILGITLILKPITIFIFPFLLIFKYRLEDKRIYADLKGSLIRMIGGVIPLGLNLIVFLLIPPLYHSFIHTNITGPSLARMNFSFSITRLLTNLFTMMEFPINHLIVFLVISIIFGIIGYLVYVIGNYGKYPLIYGYLFGMIIMLLSYFDSWDHHLVSLTPLLVIILFNLPRQSEIAKKSIKPTFFFVSFFDLLFMGIYFLTEPFFPYNFATTIFLIITFIGLINHGINNRNNKKENE